MRRIRSPAWPAATLLLVVGSAAYAQRNDVRTDSRSGYVHHVELKDARGAAIDPTAAGAAPYSPAMTCVKCHDVPSIGHGYHFNAASSPPPPAGRSGEPWWLVDRRAGTQIPLSYRGFPGSWSPDALGLTHFDIARRFGAFLPGGAVGRPADDAPTRFRLAGELDIDCLICHAAPGSGYSHERHAREVERENFAWAPAVAIGLAQVDGEVAKLKDDADAAALPQGRYDPRRFDVDGKVFLDLVRRPANDACYRCHTTRPGPDESGSAWLHDGDVHLRAGLLCVDCHRNGIDHHTVRGFAGEVVPGGARAADLTCRGCHYDTGRLGAPLPRHQGLPPLHLDALACTVCHSGPVPTTLAARVRTSQAHGLVIPSQTRAAGDPPEIVEPVYRRDAQGVIHPQRVAWPAFFGWQAADGAITPVLPDQAYAALKQAKVRIRSDFQAEIAPVRLGKDERVAALGEIAAAKADDALTAAERSALQAAESARQAAVLAENLGKGIAALGESAPAGSRAVYLALGRGHAVDATGALVRFDTSAADPVMWPIAHDVRPARQALGATGCADCHKADAPFFHGGFVALGPLPDVAPPAQTRLEALRADPTLVRAWEMLFTGRAAFKWVGLVATGCVMLLLLAIVLAAIVGLVRRRPGSAA